MNLINVELLAKEIHKKVEAYHNYDSTPCANPWISFATDLASLLEPISEIFNRHKFLTNCGLDVKKQA